MGIVELLRAVKCCTWYNVLLLSLIAAAVCMRRLPYYTEILLLVWVLAIVAFALFMSRMKEVRSIGFWHILPCALMLPIFFYSGGNSAVAAGTCRSDLCHAGLHGQ